MSYDEEIQTLIDAIKADKAIVQPWRNYAIKHLMETQAHIRMGKTTTHRSPDEPAPMQFAAPKPTCICTEMGRRKDCPVHGAAA